MLAPDYEARRDYLATFTTREAGRKASAALSALIRFDGVAQSKVDVAEWLASNGAVINHKTGRVWTSGASYWTMRALTKPTVDYLAFLIGRAA